MTATQAAAMPPTLDVRARVMLKEFVSYQALYATVPGLAIDQALNIPKEWGREGGGFARRAGSRYGRYVLGETIEFAVSGLLNEDPRYIYSKRNGMWNRTKDAITGTFLVPKVDGNSRTLAIGRIAGVFGSRAIASRWEPDSQRTIGGILQRGATGMATKTAVSIGREFWPDIRRKVFHKP
ncbi:MAG TPA: hypothetical protein VMZ52_16175 [Bryobacteraceae bacterium]|nr:hypothetical protein [Bryobacteraceae bacterium]